MSITVDKETVVNPRGFFTDDFKFDIEFECTAPIPDYIKWEVIYCGSPQTHEHDQILVTAMVGPIEVGMNRFVLTAKPPKAEKILFDEFVLSFIIIKAYYRDQEFIRISHFVNNEIPAEATSIEQLDLSKVPREIEVREPNVQISQIDWT
jgi:histone chaperone ASF1